MDTYVSAQQSYQNLIQARPSCRQASRASTELLVPMLPRQSLVRSLRSVQGRPRRGRNLHPTMISTLRLAAVKIDSPSMSARSREYCESLEPFGEKSICGTGSSRPLVSKGSSPCTSFLYTWRRFRSFDLKILLSGYDTQT